MRCANKAATEAAAQMRAAGEQVNQDSIAGVSSLSAADKHPGTSNSAGARGHSRAASSSGASAAGGRPMAVDPEIKVVDSGKSDPPPV